MKFAFLILLLSFVTKAHAAPVDAKGFNQFLYHWDNVSTNPETPDLEYYTLDSTDVPVPLASSQLRLWVTLMLIDDGTFLMTYVDGQAPMSSTDWKLRACFNLEGKWSVPEQTLLLTDNQGRPIVEGTALTLNGVSTVSFNYRASFPASEIRGKSSSYAMGQANYPPGPIQCQFPPPPLL